MSIDHVDALQTDEHFEIQDTFHPDKKSPLTHNQAGNEQNEADSQDHADVIEAVDDPHRLANVVLSYSDPLKFWHGEFYRFDGVVWRIFSTEELKADVTQIVRGYFKRVADMEAAGLPKSEAAVRVRKVTQNLLANVNGTLKSLCILPDLTTAPTWLEGDHEYQARDCLVLQNGILPLPSLNTPTATLYGLTSDLFTTNALDFEFDPHAECPEWNKFLLTIWPEDSESINAIQEMFGYLLLPTTNLQKMFTFIGPRRSGKGTIARVLLELIGRHNVAAPTLGSLATPFGLQPLLNKTLAIIGDARLSGRQDTAVISERLLSITGEDIQTVDRKHMTSITGPLPVRFVLISNELPRLNDASATLPTRMILLHFTKSFYGCEDHDLVERLLKELPGILRWALCGWQRLMKRKRFEQPTRSKHLLEELEILASPVTAFVNERCVVSPESTVPVKLLYKEWVSFCDETGTKTGSVSTFGRDLRAAVPSVNSLRLRIEGDRVRIYEGIGLKEAARP